MYGALLSSFSRWAWSRLKRRSLGLQLGLAPVVSIAVVVAGALSFEVMFWTPRGLGVLLWAATLRAPPAESPPRWLVAMPLAFHGYHLLILGWLWSVGEFADGPAKTAMVLAAAVVAMGLMLSRPSNTGTVYTA